MRAACPQRLHSTPAESSEFGSFSSVLRATLPKTGGIVKDILKDIEDSFRVPKALPRGI
jgi:hypothetical protein